MFKVNIASSSGFNTQQQQTLVAAMQKFQVTMNSEELRIQILTFSCPLGNRFEDNQGMTNQQVFEKLFAGQEVYRPEIDYTADLHLNLIQKRKPFFSRHPAIGFGNSGQKTINTYSWWFNSATANQYAGHIAHEWSHKVGFEHSFNPTPLRDYSVPYAFGKIVEEICGKFSLQQGNHP